MKILKICVPLLFSFFVVLFFQQKVFAQERLPNIPLCATERGSHRHAYLTQALHTQSPKPILAKQASQDKIHVIDIAFIYSGSIFNTVRLMRHVIAAVLKANVIFALSNVNARLRTVAVQPDHKYNISLKKVGLLSAIDLMNNILPDVRSDYGADLLYALTNKPDSEACGRASIRSPWHNKRFAAQKIATGAIFYGGDNSQFSCLGDNYILVHEVGHNLGLVHEIENDSSIPFLSYGRGYKGKNTKNQRDYVTVMGGKSGLSRWNRFSSESLQYGLQMGSSQANAAKALLYTIEDASNYAPTKVKDPARNSHL